MIVLTIQPGGHMLSEENLSYYEIENAIGGDITPLPLVNSGTSKQRFLALVYDKTATNRGTKHPSVVLTVNTVQRAILAGNVILLAYDRSIKTDKKKKHQFDGLTPEEIAHLKGSVSTTLQQTGYGRHATLRRIDKLQFPLLFETV